MTHAIRTAARFSSDREALEAVQDLEALGQGDHLHVEVHRGVDHELERAETRLLTGVVTGMAIGAPLGIVVGLLVMVVADRVIGDISQGMILGLGIGAGFMFGLLVGGIGGLVVRSAELESARDLGNLHLRDDEDVVVTWIDGTDDPAVVGEVRRVMLGHHGSFVHL